MYSVTGLWCFNNVLGERHVLSYDIVKHYNPVTLYKVSHCIPDMIRCAMHVCALAAHPAQPHPDPKPCWSPSSYAAASEPKLPRVKAGAAKVITLGHLWVLPATIDVGQPRAYGFKNN